MIITYVLLVRGFIKLVIKFDCTKHSDKYFFLLVITFLLVLINEFSKTEGHM